MEQRSARIALTQAYMAFRMKRIDREQWISDTGKMLTRVRGLKESDMMLYHTRDDKYQLNLQTANYYNMIHEGILPDNIGISDICTSCNSDWLFSHRASHGKRGVLCGFMSICR